MTCCTPSVLLWFGSRDPYMIALSRVPMTCRRRRTDSESNKEQQELLTLTAMSSRQLLWPLPIFHASNVLSRGDAYCWNSGVYAPAVICLEVHTAPVHLARVALQVEMYPDGDVHHEIRAGPSITETKVATKIEKHAKHGEWIHLSVSSENARFILIVTHKSPSHVAWRRIRIWKFVE